MKQNIHSGFRDLSGDMRHCLHHLEQLSPEDPIHQELHQYFIEWVHEFRTPLSAVLGFSRLLVEDTTLSPKQRDTVQKLYQAGQVVLQVVNAFAESIPPQQRS
jgi:signal transduction histidine kinase